MFSRHLWDGETRRAHGLRRIDAAIERFSRAVGELSVLARSVSPLAWRRKAPEDQNPLLLVHGFGCDLGSLGTLARRFAHDGWRVFPIELDTVNRSVENLAERLARQVARVRRRLGVERVDLIGHSLGGLIIRYYVQMLEGWNEVDRVVTVGTPHSGGTWASYAVYPLRRLGFLPTPLPSETHSVDQLMPGSSFYEDVNGPVYRVENCARVDFTNVWSLADECVLPTWRARFPWAAREHRFSALGHLGLVISGTASEAIRQSLLAPPRPPLHLMEPGAAAGVGRPG
jgi:triacylglycerol lipase